MLIDESLIVPERHLNTVLPLSDVPKKQVSGWQIGPEAARVQVLFVTVDPERDTPQVLAQYVPAFDPRFLGLWGDAEATQRAAKEFRIFYAKSQTGSAPGAYTMDHSAQSFVFDPAGRLRLMARPERIAQDLAEDLRTLLESAS